MDKRLLTEREFNTLDFPNLPESWYAAREHFQGFKSVVRADYYDTCSSAGDWGGYIEQVLNKTTYLILFSQTNNYPHAGYTVNTGKAIATWQGDLTKDEVYQIIEEHNSY